MAPQPQRARSWVWTLNNYTPEEVNSITAVGDSCPKIAYLVFGQEIAPETGTPHLQGFVQFNNALSMAGIHDLMGFKRAHLIVKSGRSTFNEAIEYCTKDGVYSEFGTRPIDPKQKGEGERARWLKIIKLAKAGRGTDLADEFPGVYIRQYRTLLQITKDHLKMPLDIDGPGRVGVWIWGPAGTGKSRMARFNWPDAYKKQYNKWWDGYTGQENVIMDEMEKEGSMFGHHLKIWTDRYAFMGEVKGGNLAMRPKQFIVTSNYSIDDIFQEPELNAAIKRRFTQIHLKDNWTPENNPYVVIPPGSEEKVVIDLTEPPQDSATPHVVDSEDLALRYV